MGGQVEGAGVVVVVGHVRTYVAEGAGVVVVVGHVGT